MAMDNRGNIVIEVAIVLTVILMIVGIVLNLSENVTQKAVKTSKEKILKCLFQKL